MTEGNSKSSTTTQLSIAGLNVGLVDDDKATARVYAKWLEQAGAHVQVFHSFSELREALEGPKGWTTLSKQAPDLLMTDLILPDGTGVDVVTTWRKYFLQNPVLIITAFATVENAVESMKSGAFDFLRKPIEQEQLVLSVQRAQDYIHLLRENEHLSAAVRIFGMAQTLSSIHEKYALLKTLGRILLREMKAQECFVFLYQNNRKQVECLLDTRAPGLPRLPPETVISSLLIHHIEKDRRAWINADTPTPVIVRQMISGANALVIGLHSSALNSAFVVLFDRANPETMDDRKTELMPILLQAARAFENADNTERITSLSYVDDLTGLYNQRYMDMTLENEVIRAERYGTPVSLIFFDLDKFKPINDTHGHLVGSRVLAEAAKILRQSMRDSDILLRYGGDEFVAILPNTRINGAMILAERLRESFDTTRFDVRAETNVASAHNLHVTASIGVACYPETAVSVRDLVQAADMAMYDSKHRGKNCVTQAPLKSKKSTE